MARGVSKVRAGGRQGKAARGAAREGGSRASLYDEVTATIIEQLEAGVFPWVRPWSKAKAALGLPRNAVTKRAYSGINILVLWSAVIEGGFPSQDWLTFRQAQAAGGCVRKGERGRTVFYADRFVPRKDRDAAPERERDEDEARAIPFLKRFTVFNAAQCEGLPEGLVAEPAALPPREMHRAAEELIAATGADFRIGGSEAYYAPLADFVMVPPQGAFHHQIDYYRTALHELGHWTGHGSRLDRDQKGRFGSAPYAREELVAELASAFLCAALGIEPTVRHADYLGSWLAVLRVDNRAIFRAASQASKAADYLLQCGAAASEEQAA
jgi:antirestriction protein ArdC